MARLTADELASQFYAQGRSGFLTAKQSAFLADLAARQRGQGSPRGECDGALLDGQGAAIGSWYLSRPSPINGCAVLRVSLFADLPDRADELADEYEQARYAAHVEALYALGPGREDEARALIAAYRTSR